MIRWLTFLKNMTNAAGHGSFFPSRAPVATAPGGTVDPQPTADVLTRLQAEHGWFEYSHHTLPISGLTERIRILHLTDVHIRQEDEALSALCHKVSQARPDLVVITGDVVTRGWSEEAVVRFLRALPPARLGRFAIMGNWEYWSGASLDRWRPLLAAHDVVLLHEDWVDLGPIVLAGTDDHLAGQSEPEVLLSRLPRDRPAVMLTHSPAFFPSLAEPPVKLVLSGHSHGGQVRIPGLGALWAPRGTGSYLAGWFEKDGCYLFVSRGLGWSVAPLRLYCPPELAWIDLTPA
ncbi:MAG: metallophosphoesterase [Myxococcota bacterium]|nr:metallophosphoesterase [Myxococcota bacterium]